MDKLKAKKSYPDKPAGFFFRILSAALSFLLFWNSISWAAGYEKMSDLLAPSDFPSLGRLSQEKADTEIFIKQWMPSGIQGEVRDYFIGKAQQPLVIHIQDAHANESAQKNIALMIHEISKKQKIDLVAVEGAEGVLMPELFGVFSNFKARRDVSRFFLKEGRLTGAEYAAILDQPKWELFGAEDSGLYEENRKAYFEILNFQKETHEEGKVLDKIFTSAIRFIFTENLQAMHFKKKKTGLGASNLSAYLDFVTDSAQREGLDLAKYPAFQAWKEIRGFEASYDLKEIQETIDFVKEKNPEALKLKQVYARYLKFQKTIVQRLDEDLLLLENSLKEKWMQTEKARELDRFLSAFEVVRRGWEIQLTREDVNFYKNNQPYFEAERIKSFLNELQQNYAFSESLPDSVRGLFSNFYKVENFYKLALERDEKIIQNTLKRLHEKNGKIAIVVTGGFHTPGIKKQLKQQGDSYLVIRPKIFQHKEKEVSRLYEEALFEKPLPFQNAILESFLKPAISNTHQLKYQLNARMLVPPLRNPKILINSNESFAVPALFFAWLLYVSVFEIRSVEKTISEAADAINQSGLISAADKQVFSQYFEYAAASLGYREFGPSDPRPSLPGFQVLTYRGPERGMVIERMNGDFPLIRRSPWNKGRHSKSGSLKLGASRVEVFENVPREFFGNVRGPVFLQPEKKKGKRKPAKNTKKLTASASQPIKAQVTDQLAPDLQALQETESLEKKTAVSRKFVFASGFIGAGIILAVYLRANRENARNRSELRLPPKQNLFLTKVKTFVKTLLHWVSSPNSRLSASRKVPRLEALEDRLALSGFYGLETPVMGREISSSEKVAPQPDSEERNSEMIFSPKTAALAGAVALSAAVGSVRQEDKNPDGEPQTDARDLLFASGKLLESLRDPFEMAPGDSLRVEPVPLEPSTGTGLIENEEHPELGAVDEAESFAELSINRETLDLGSKIPPSSDDTISGSDSLTSIGLKQARNEDMKSPEEISAFSADEFAASLNSQAIVQATGGIENRELFFTGANPRGFVDPPLETSFLGDSQTENFRSLFASLQEASPETVESQAHVTSEDHQIVKVEETYKIGDTVFKEVSIFDYDPHTGRLESWEFSKYVNGAQVLLQKIEKGGFEYDLNGSVTAYHGYRVGPHADMYEIHGYYFRNGAGLVEREDVTVKGRDGRVTEETTVYHPLQGDRAELTYYSSGRPEGKSRQVSLDSKNPMIQVPHETKIQGKSGEIKIEAHVKKFEEEKSSSPSAQVLRAKEGTTKTETRTQTSTVVRDIGGTARGAVVTPGGFGSSKESEPGLGIGDIGTFNPERELAKEKKEAGEINPEVPFPVQTQPNEERKITPLRASDRAEQPVQSGRDEKGTESRKNEKDETKTSLFPAVRAHQQQKEPPKIQGLPIFVPILTFFLGMAVWSVAGFTANFTRSRKKTDSGGEANSPEREPKKKKGKPEDGKPREIIYKINDGTRKVDFEPDSTKPGLMDGAFETPMPAPQSDSEPDSGKVNAFNPVQDGQKEIPVFEDPKAKNLRSWGNSPREGKNRSELRTKRPAGVSVLIHFLAFLVIGLSVAFLSAQTPQKKEPAPKHVKVENKKEQKTATTQKILRGKEPAVIMPYQTGKETGFPISAPVTGKYKFSKKLKDALDEMEKNPDKKRNELYVSEGTVLYEGVDENLELSLEKITKDLNLLQTNYDRQKKIPASVRNPADFEGLGQKILAMRLQKVRMLQNRELGIVRAPGNGYLKVETLSGRREYLVHKDSKQIIYIGASAGTALAGFIPANRGMIKIAFSIDDFREYALSSDFNFSIHARMKEGLLPAEAQVIYVEPFSEGAAFIHATVGIYFPQSPRGLPSHAEWEIAAGSKPASSGRSVIAQARVVPRVPFELSAPLLPGEWRLKIPEYSRFSAGDVIGEVDNGKVLIASLKAMDPLLLRGERWRRLSLPGSVAEGVRMGIPYTLGNDAYSRLVFDLDGNLNEAESLKALSKRTVVTATQGGILIPMPEMNGQNVTYGKTVVKGMPDYILLTDIEVQKSQGRAPVGIGDVIKIYVSRQDYYLGVVRNLDPLPGPLAGRDRSNYIVLTEVMVPYAPLFFADNSYRDVVIPYPVEQAELKKELREKRLVFETRGRHVIWKQGELPPSLSNWLVHGTKTKTQADEKAEFLKLVLSQSSMNERVILLDRHFSRVSQDASLAPFLEEMISQKGDYPYREDVAEKAVSYLKDNKNTPELILILDKISANAKAGKGAELAQRAFFDLLITDPESMTRIVTESNLVSGSDFRAKAESLFLSLALEKSKAGQWNDAALLRILRSSFWTNEDLADFVVSSAFPSELKDLLERELERRQGERIARHGQLGFPGQTLKKDIGSLVVYPEERDKIRMEEAFIFRGAYLFFTSSSRWMDWRLYTFSGFREEIDKEIVKLKQGAEEAPPVSLRALAGEPDFAARFLTLDEPGRLKEINSLAASKKFAELDQLLSVPAARNGFEGLLVDLALNSPEGRYFLARRYTLLDPDVPEDEKLMEIIESKDLFKRLNEDLTRLREMETLQQVKEQTAGWGDFHPDSMTPAKRNVYLEAFLIQYQRVQGQPAPEVRTFLLTVALRTLVQNEYELASLYNLSGTAEDAQNPLKQIFLKAGVPRGTLESLARERLGRRVLMFSILMAREKYGFTTDFLAIPGLDDLTYQNMEQWDEKTQFQTISFEEILKRAVEDKKISKESYDAILKNHERMMNDLSNNKHSITTQKEAIAVMSWPLKVGLASLGFFYILRYALLFVRGFFNRVRLHTETPSVETVKVEADLLVQNENLEKLGGNLKAWAELLKGDVLTDADDSTILNYARQNLIEGQHWTTLDNRGRISFKMSDTMKNADEKDLKGRLDDLMVFFQLIKLSLDRLQVEADRLTEGLASKTGTDREFDVIEIRRLLAQKKLLRQMGAAGEMLRKAVSRLRALKINYKYQFTRLIHPSTPWGFFATLVNRLLIFIYTVIRWVPLLMGPSALLQKLFFYYNYKSFLNAMEEILPGSIPENELPEVGENLNSAFEPEEEARSRFGVANSSQLSDFVSRLLFTLSIVFPFILILPGFFGAIPPIIVTWCGSLFLGIAVVFIIWKLSQRPAANGHSAALKAAMPFIIAFAITIPALLFLSPDNPEFPMAVTAGAVSTLPPNGNSDGPKKENGNGIGVYVFLIALAILIPTVLILPVYITGIPIIINWYGSIFFGLGAIFFIYGLWRHWLPTFHNWAVPLYSFNRRVLKFHEKKTESSLRRLSELEKRQFSSRPSGHLPLLLQLENEEARLAVKYEKNAAYPSVDFVIAVHPDIADPLKRAAILAMIGKYFPSLPNGEPAIPVILLTPEMAGSGNAYLQAENYLMGPDYEKLREKYPRLPLNFSMSNGIYLIPQQETDSPLSILSGTDNRPSLFPDTEENLFQSSWEDMLIQGIKTMVLMRRRDGIIDETTPRKRGLRFVATESGMIFRGSAYPRGHFTVVGAFENLIAVMSQDRSVIDSPWGEELFTFLQRPDGATVNDHIKAKRSRLARFADSSNVFSQQHAAYAGIFLLNFEADDDEYYEAYQTLIRLLYQKAKEMAAKFPGKVFKVNIEDVLVGITLGEQAHKIDERLAVGEIGVEASSETAVNQRGLQLIFQNKTPEGYVGVRTRNLPEALQAAFHEWFDIFVVQAGERKNGVRKLEFRVTQHTPPPQQAISVDLTNAGVFYDYAREGGIFALSPDEVQPQLSAYKIQVTPKGIFINAAPKDLPVSKPVIFAETQSKHPTLMKKAYVFMGLQENIFNPRRADKTVLGKDIKRVMSRLKDSGGKRYYSNEELAQTSAEDFAIYPENSVSDESVREWIRVLSLDNEDSIVLNLSRAEWEQHHVSINHIKRSLGVDQEAQLSIVMSELRAERKQKGSKKKKAAKEDGETRKRKQVIEKKEPKTWDFVDLRTRLETIFRAQQKLHPSLRLLQQAHVDAFLVKAVNGSLLPPRGEMLKAVSYNAGGEVSLGIIDRTVLEYYLSPGGTIHEALTEELKAAGASTLGRDTTRIFAVTPGKKLIVIQKASKKAEGRTFNVPGGHVQSSDGNADDSAPDGTDAAKEETEIPHYLSAAEAEFRQELDLPENFKFDPARLIFLGSLGSGSLNEGKTNKTYIYYLNKKETNLARESAGRLSAKAKQLKSKKFQMYLDEQKKKGEGKGEVMKIKFVDLSQMSAFVAENKIKLSSSFIYLIHHPSLQKAMKLNFRSELRSSRFYSALEESLAEARDLQRQESAFFSDLAAWSLKEWNEDPVEFSVRLAQFFQAYGQMKKAGKTGAADSSFDYVFEYGSGELTYAFLNQLIMKLSPRSRLILTSVEGISASEAKRRHDELNTLLKALPDKIRVRIKLLDYEWNTGRYVSLRMRQIPGSDVLWLDKSENSGISGEVESQIYLEAGELTYHYLVVAGSAKKPDEGVSILSLAGILSATRRLQSSA